MRRVLVVLFFAFVVLSTSVEDGLTASGQTLPQVPIYVPIIRSAPNTPTPTVTSTPTLTPTATDTMMPTATTTSTVTPTNTSAPVATTTATATSSPTTTAISTPTATPTQSESVRVLANGSWFVAPADTLHIVGQVWNQSISNIQFVNVTANVFDVSNQIVATGSKTASPPVLQPGQKSCFHIVVDAPSAWDHFEFSTTHQDGGEIAPSLMPLNVLTGNNQLGTPVITGQVRNDGSGRATFVRVVGTLFDASLTVIGCQTANVSGLGLNPGQTGNFSIEFYPLINPPIDSYSLQVQGVPQ